MNHEFFMQLALRQARKAFEEGEFPVGCVIAMGKKVIAVGSRKGTINNTHNEIDHAEMIALHHLDRFDGNFRGKKVTLFCTLEPCLMCFGAILLKGIENIVYSYEDVMGGGTTCDLSKLKPLYQDAKITITSNILRNESLYLFKQFFLKPENTYWKGSFLAEYTLNQPV